MPRRKLPRWPVSPNDPSPSVVVGELHHPTASCESEWPSRIVIAETGLYTGVPIVGAVGSGKTSACMYSFSRRSAHGAIPGRQSSNYIQECTICVSCRMTTLDSTVSL